MNIGTGGGTLVHELTHSLIAFDFPHVPDWFNEGLASLPSDAGSGPMDRGSRPAELAVAAVATSDPRRNKLRSLKSLIRPMIFAADQSG